MKPQWINKNLCFAPFNQVYIGLNQQVGPCCASTDNFGSYTNTSIEDVYNSSRAKQTRQMFLDGKFPESCKVCSKYIEQTNSQQPVHKFSNNLAFANIELSKQVLKDDLINQSPIFLDLLVSNQCNFACIGCGSNLSSTWAKNYTDIEKVINKDIKDITPASEWNNDIDAVLEYIIKHKNSLKMLHLNGGEPFIQDQFYKVLQMLIDENMTGIKIFTHTNGSISTYKGKDIVNDYLSHFTNFSVTFSHDHFGDRGYYIRYPLSDSKWLKNYNRVKQTVAQVNVQTSYSLFNCLTLDTLEEWYETNNVDLTYWIINPWFGPKPYTTEILHEYPDLLSNAKDVLNNMKTTHPIIDYLKNKNTVEKNIMLRNLRDSILLWDQRRNTDFKKTFPELMDLI